jgi:hypothetical protein
LCAHQEIIESVPALFGDADGEKEQAVTYEPRWVMSGRNPDHPRGILRLYVCRHCGFAQSFALDPGSIPIGKDHRTRLIRRPDAMPTDPTRHRLQTHHGALYLSDTSLDQEWPNGVVHSVAWDLPFTAAFHRAPPLGFTGPVADVHVRLHQHGSSESAMVAFTVSVGDAPKLRQLEPLVALLPKIEGSEAEVVLTRLGVALKAHGAPMPL